MDSLTLSAEFKKELAQLIFLTHVVYSVVFYILFRDFDFQSADLLGIELSGPLLSSLPIVIFIIILIIIYIAPIPLMYKFFVNEEKKKIIKGKGTDTLEKKGVEMVLTYRGEIKGYFTAIFLSIGIYLPFTILLIIIRFLIF